MKNLFIMSVFSLIIVFMKSNDYSAFEVLYEEGSSLIMTTRSHQNAHSLSIYMKPAGVNALFSIQKIDMIKIKNFFEKTLFQVNSNTDWIGPYMVRDLEILQSQNIEPKFTGGWHGSNGDSTGLATAYTKNVVVYLDDYLVTDNLTGQLSCQEITVIVTNQIKGYNTDNYILEEVINYHIYNNRINIHVITTALANIEIMKYYGLQTQNKIWSNTIQYIGDTKTSQSYKSSIDSASYTKSSNTVINKIKLTSEDNHFVLIAWLDRTVDLGLGKYLSEDQPYAFTCHYGKSYFNLINGNSLIMEKGDTMEWKGGYILESN